MVDKTKTTTQYFKDIYSDTILPGFDLPAKLSSEKTGISPHTFVKNGSSWLRCYWTAILTSSPSFHLGDQTAMPSLSKSEQELHIWKSADEGHYTVYCTNPTELPYYLDLAKRVGGVVARHQGGTKIQLPKDAVALQMRRKLNLSQSARAERAQQMKQRQARKPATSAPPA